MDTKVFAWGYTENEMLNIQADSWEKGFFCLGKEMKKENQEALKAVIGTIPKNKREEVIAQAGGRLEWLRVLADSRLFDVNGVDYLTRYLSAYEAYCQGSDLDINEAAYFQMEMPHGCQTLLVQDKESGEILVAHTEENAPDYSISRKSEYPYRWVSMGVGRDKYSYIAYPGLVSFGVGFGINELTGLVQTVDDISPRNEYFRGALWATAIAHMMLDCGDIGIARELISRMKSVSEVRFSGGYAIHLAQSGVKPEMCTVEFIGNLVKILEPQDIGEKLVIAAANRPSDAEIARMSFASLPDSGDTWEDIDKTIYLEINGREKRMLQMARDLVWRRGNESEMIGEALKVLAIPEGDLERVKEGTGFRYFSTAFPSEWVLAHGVAFVDRHGTCLYSGKNLPDPIPGREYSLNVGLDYEYGGDKLWEEIEKL